ncbi:hypothetical protein UFOVP410_60 [uncultured Caudovirales phage]|uniref:Uncharacterized protein n=1 Tax=uncultured Caudovirales phage TaxID=2100421 RepID=A0A6J5M520_9CAUD|nr:hypothetical protein UFOVP410_60 [uncultured Caudovirales phage]
MIKFKQFIVESETKNQHLEHLEDEVFNGGVAGTRRALNFLRGLRDMLSGSSDSSVNVTVKWDGAPAIICGINPENKRFFVATKSAFNKNPKLNYTNSDIETNHGNSPGLIQKLKIALNSLSKLGIKGILQGDLLFTKEDLVPMENEGEKLISFKPNTIRYAVPLDSDLARKIMSSDMGIVFHTTYTGKTIESMKANFGANVDYLKKSSRVWVTDATFKDESGTATLTESEMEYVTDRLSKIGKIFNKMNSSVITQIISDEQLKIYIKTYINSKVRTGQSIEGTKQYADGLITFIKEKFQKEIDKLKTEKGKLGREEKLKQVVSFVNSNKEQFIIMFLVAALMADVKGLLINKLKKVSSIGTFLETPDGFKVTSPEGFVAIDRLGAAVKLVDRLEFSRANFNLEKSW